jgi:hypothetical protein
MLKAIEYWKLRHKDKHLEWVYRHRALCDARYLRAAQLREGRISPGEAFSGNVCEDDGYISGPDREGNEDWGYSESDSEYDADENGL